MPDPRHVLRFALVGALACMPTLAACRGDDVAVREIEPPAAPVDSTQPDTVPPRGPYADAVQRLARFIEQERVDKAIPALSVALIDDQETVWAAGFGEADPETGAPATAATVYRVGSVSKLFTDVAIMQRVERGELDLDAPIDEYVAEFRLAEGPTPTLRQLTSHQAGIVREPPVGHYFDATAPTLEATVASLIGTRHVYPPETRTKYSNAGIALVGYALERQSGVPFADYVQAEVLQPLGMERSSFLPTPTVTRRLAKARMWSYDGREFPAPTFELGMAPAGSMYAPVTDVARFVSAVFAGGNGARGRVLSAASIDTMLTPQFAEPGATSGFGIGFSLGTLDGHRYAGHGGAIYGFATQLAMLPDQKLGAVAATSMDMANTVADRVTDYALRLMLAVRAGEALPSPEISSAVPDSLVDVLPGRYETADGSRTIEIEKRGASDWRGPLTARFGSARYRVRWLDSQLVLDDRHGWGGYLRPAGSALVARDDTRFEQVEEPPYPRPADAGERVRGLIGEYGWDHNILILYEGEGTLHALVEWAFDYPLTAAGNDTWDFPDAGLYHGESIRFRRGPDGRATSAVMAGIDFPRRPSAEGLFTIEPRLPIDSLRTLARAATPPPETGTFREPDLVELRSLDSTIVYDIRYATTQNFMQEAFYQEPHAFLQRPAAEAVVRAHRALEAFGYGLLIHDAYRPWFVTKMFYDATPEAQRQFVADPANGSRHNRGAAVDLTLYYLETGQPVEMTGGYDEFSARSYPDYIGGTALQRWHRDLLRRVMEAEGFDVYQYEWWHFDYHDWREYPILDLTFEEIER